MQSLEKPFGPVVGDWIGLAGCGGMSAVFIVASFLWAPEQGEKRH